MSYDLIAFSKKAAPKTRPDFLDWYDAQTSWAEDHTYDDPAITTLELQSWLMEMVQTFPDLNGPDATDDHTNDYETDYSIGYVVVYASFSWSLAKEAYETAYQLAKKHQVGLYDISFESPILLPDDDQLKPMENEASPKTKRKSWWKFW